ncbi:MAG: type II toxin-antitoxin system RatA family toxin [Pseudomonadota bacterium]
MPKLSEQVLILHSAENLYELVRDVRRYPEFIKWISDMTVRNEDTRDGVYRCVGQARVGFKGFDERFSTHVEANPDDREINVRLERGPFRHLINRWRFQPLEADRTRVHFFIDYEFNNPLLTLLARTNTQLAVDRIISAFRTEADRRFAGDKV